MRRQENATARQFISGSMLIMKASLVSHRHKTKAPLEKGRQEITLKMTFLQIQLGCRTVLDKLASGKIQTTTVKVLLVVQKVYKSSAQLKVILNYM